MLSGRQHSLVDNLGSSKSLKALAQGDTVIRMLELSAV